MCFSLIWVPFKNVKEKWVSDITKHCPGVPFILAGLKLDIRDDKEALNKLASKQMKLVRTEVLDTQNMKMCTGETFQAFLQKTNRCSGKEMEHGRCIIVQETYVSEHVLITSIDLICVVYD